MEWMRCDPPGSDRLRVAQKMRRGRMWGESAAGTAALTVSEMLKKNGIETKHHKRRRKQNRP